MHARVRGRPTTVTHNVRRSSGKLASLQATSPSDVSKKERSEERGRVAMSEWFRLGAVLAFAISAFSFCTATVGAQETDDVDRIKERGTLRVGYAESVPFQFKDPQTGEWIGF